MKKLFFIAMLLCLAFTATTVKANGPETIPEEFSVDSGVTLAYATPTQKPVFAYAMELKDSLAAIMAVTPDAETRFVIQKAIDQIKAAPEKGSTIATWVNWVTGVVAAITAAITTLYFKVIAIRDKLPSRTN